MTKSENVNCPQILKVVFRKNRDWELVMSPNLAQLFGFPQPA